MAFDVLVSIIIPTYNRADLLRETLQSIRNQTYTAWECIVVDDHSDDNTAEVVLSFSESDTRFHYYKRPATRPKGANACRNFGFSQSKGNYVIWFDSDDLMLEYKIERQVQALEASNCDFCVCRFANFSGQNHVVSESSFDRNRNNSLEIKHFMTNAVFWGTIDFLGRRSIVEQISFNEELPSGQDYNFFMKVLSGKPVGCFIDEDLSLRRLHTESIQQVQAAHKTKRLRNKFLIYWLTARDCKDIAGREVTSYLLLHATLFYHKLALQRILMLPLSELISVISHNFGRRRAFVLYVLLQLAYVTKKGHVPGSRLIKKYLNAKPEPDAI